MHRDRVLPGACADEQERLQWQNDPQYAGVLQQRVQAGMLSMPGVTLELLKTMYTAANHFVQSKVFLYFTQGECAPGIE